MATVATMACGNTSPAVVRVGALPDPGACRASLEYRLEALELVPYGDLPDQGTKVGILAARLQLGDQALCDLAAGLAFMPDPCGSPLSVLEALSTEVKCMLRIELGRHAVRLARSGYGAQVIAVELFRDLARERARRADFILDDAPALGLASASHILVEFLNFKCPHCRRVSQGVKDLVRAHPNVRLFIKHYPLSHEAATARASAIASLAAAQQGRFWEAHDVFYARQDELEEDTIPMLLLAAGVDVDKARAAMADPALAALVDRDVKEAEVADISGTPAFYLDGKVVGSFEALQERVGSLTKEVTAGVSPRREQP